MKTTVADILDRLEEHYGQQKITWPTDPYLFLVWWHCGYPASDKACSKGWDELNRSVGVAPEKILRASPDKLGDALRPGRNGAGTAGCAA
jgi:endonuclease III